MAKNIYQQIYCLSSAANAVGSMDGTEAALQAAEEKALNWELSTIDNGQWSVTWGPRVYKSHPEVATTGPDNVWYCAVNDTRRTCVMAVAGTAYDSVFDWLQNGNVGSVFDFDAWTATWVGEGVKLPQQPAIPQPNDNRALIAKGTAEFVVNILSKTSPDTGKRPRTKVMEYLQEVQFLHPDYTIVITGHSMGGAVVPAIALGLVQSRYITHNNVWVMPSAGPTPGNANFNAEFKKQFSPSIGIGYERYNVNYYNNHDVVPQAWSTNMNDDRNLTNIIEKIYVAKDQLPQTELWIIGAVGAAANLVEKNMVYSPLQGQDFTGKPIPHKIQDPDVSVKQLENVVIEQHTDEYWKSIGILGWVDNFTTRLAAQPGVTPRRNKKVQEGDSTKAKESEVKGDTVVDAKQPAQVDIKALPTV